MTPLPPYDDDDDYHESVSRTVPSAWANGRSNRVASPGRLWTSPRAYSVFTARSLTGPYQSRQEEDVEMRPHSTSRCLHTVLLLVGAITVLSILAVVLLATVGLNNLASAT